MEALPLIMRAFWAGRVGGSKPERYHSLMSFGGGSLFILYCLSARSLIPAARIFSLFRVLFYFDLIRVFFSTIFKIY